MPITRACDYNVPKHVDEDGQSPKNNPELGWKTFQANGDHPMLSTA